MNKTTVNWHQQKIETALDTLQSTEAGLTTSEATRRLDQFGPNALKEKGRKSLGMMLLDQFKDFMILVLISAAFIAGVIGEPVDSIAIAVIVVLNAILGFVQEYRAEKAMAALKKLSAPSAVIVRDGQSTTVPAEKLVPGDIVLLEAGKIIPADLRLIETAQLQVQEATLTGESLPVEKNTASLDTPDLSLGDRLNMAYKGTMVSAGRGRGMVTETGMQTELGKIAGLIQGQEEERTPLQKRLTGFGKRLSYIVLAICVIVFIAGILRGEPPLLMLLTAISLAVAAIPEALPAVITISLALGARKLVKQQSLVRKLPAVETLGSVTYVCSDKTGTLTMNRMAVEQACVHDQILAVQALSSELSPKNNFENYPLENPVHLLFSAMSLCNDTEIDATGQLLGDPTETALFELARKNGYLRKTLEKITPRITEIPFDSDRKLMSTFHRLPDNRYVAFTKGAVEELLERSQMAFHQAEPEAIHGQRIHDAAEKLAGEGLRTLGFAMRIWDTLPDTISTEVSEQNLVFIGMVGMMDPPRPEAAEAVAMCRSAGIHPVMITGDHPLTASIIAERVGIKDPDGPPVMTGRELAQLSMDQLKERVEETQVYARVAPDQKLKIVNALQEKGHFVSMTGDGVNDAPALKRADIGVAMGITGTDVSKEASHMILLDDNFATIVKAVREGRRIFDNIRKFIKYTMTSNVGEIFTIFLAPFFGLPIPLLPIHILWINLVTDGVPGLALTVEPGETDLMDRPPRNPKEGIFSNGLGIHILWVGLLMGAVSIVTQALFIQRSQATWQTMVFTVLCLSQMGNVLAIRSSKQSFFKQGFRSNLPLTGAVLLTFALQLTTIYVPYFNPIFKTTPLTITELIVTIFLSTIVFMAVEIEKWFRR